MASIQSRLFTLFLRLVDKKSFLKRRLDKGSPNYFSCPQPPAKLFAGDIIEKFRINSSNVFTIRSRAANNRKHILYLHGGAYVQSFSRPHWSFLADILKTTGCTVTAPDYPLAPSYTYVDSFDIVLRLYRQLMQTNDAKNLVLMGDSAGGGFALALAQRLREEHLPQPGQIILLSPWLDITLRNESIKSIDRIDPFLGIEGLLEAGKQYAGSASPDNYLLSPVYGSLKGLGKIFVFAGSNEILVADTRKLKSLAAIQQVEIAYYEYPDMFHAWMLLNLPESKKAKQQLAALINSY